MKMISHTTILSPSTKTPVLVPMRAIFDNPYQARKEYDPEMIQRLADSIRSVGKLLQTPMARKSSNGEYQLAFGHQRKRACLLLGWTDMPLIVEELTDRQMFEISITENIKRHDLNPIEKAAMYKKYMDEFEATSVEAAQLFEVKDSTVRGMVRFLNLPADARKKLARREINFTQAKNILAKPETKQRRLKIRETIEAGELAFSLRDQLLYQLYGALRTDVTDEMIFKKIKGICDERDQLQRQVELINKNRREQRQSSLHIVQGDS